MEKVSQISFILKEDKLSKLIFRFLPQLSSCHSFDNNPPKSWQEVYKVYYAYEIVEQWFDEGQNNEDVWFSTSFDECSVIDAVAKLIGQLGWSSFCSKTFTPCGDGVQWKLQKRRYQGKELGIKFELWKRNNVGYRIFLPEEQCIAFAKFLNDCCEYMLAHGEPI